MLLLAFVVSFILTRGYTRLARKHGWGSTSIAGVHTHHLVYGMVAVLISGGLMFGFTPKEGVFYDLLAIAFGGGAALVLDEFALIFHLEDVYWEREGRKSIDAVILGIIFGALFLLRTTPFGTGTDQTTLAVFVTIAINLPIVIVAALKGKLYFAIVGVFIPALSIVGAVRLAEPTSLWARRFYKPGGRRMRLSVERYELYHKYVHSLREYVFDLIGGKPGRPYRPKPIHRKRNRRKKNRRSRG